MSTERPPKGRPGLVGWWRPERPRHATPAAAPCCCCCRRFPDAARAPARTPVNCCCCCCGGSTCYGVKAARQATGPGRAWGASRMAVRAPDNYGSGVRPALHACTACPPPFPQHTSALWQRVNTPFSIAVSHGACGLCVCVCVWGGGGDGRDGCSRLCLPGPCPPHLHRTPTPGAATPRHTQAAAQHPI